jgi:uncharacterized membrane protein YfcA
MSDWIIWAALLLAQQASQTATSRARNTKGRAGLWYNAIASVFSNGVWFGSQLYIVTLLIAARDDTAKFVSTLAFYVFFTVLGSVTMHWWLMRIEKKRGLEHG